MPKPNKETLEVLRNITVEIGAGMVLLPRSPEEHAWNNAHERAKNIISNYAEGYGLFQMTRDLAAKQEKVNARGEAVNALLPDPSAVCAPVETIGQGTRALDSTPGHSARKRQGTARKAR
jgi:hypothetical protein